MSGTLLTSTQGLLQRSAIRTKYMPTHVAQRSHISKTQLPNSIKIGSHLGPHCSADFPVPHRMFRGSRRSRYSLEGGFLKSRLECYPSGPLFFFPLGLTPVLHSRALLEDVSLLNLYLYDEESDLLSP